jgi:hypothetical protein
MSNPKRTPQVVLCLALLCVTVAAAGRAVAPGAAPARAAQGADDAKQPFQKMLVVSLDPGEFSETVSFTVPVGKRLVVETASANAAVPSGQKVTVNVATTGGGLSGRAWLALAAQGAVSGLDRHTTTQPMRMYADPGTAVAFQAVRSDAASTATLNFSVAGYLVDAP